MKLLSLNSRSLLQANYEEKQAVFLKFMLRALPDLIALWEANQTAPASAACDCRGMFRLPVCEIPLKEFRHAPSAARHCMDGKIQRRPVISACLRKPRRDEASEAAEGE